MNKTISVDSNTLQTILNRLDQLTKDIEAIKEKLFEQEPPYGSDEWWDWTIKKSEEDFKKGNSISFKSAKDAIKWLNSLD